MLSKLSIVQSPYATCYGSILRLQSHSKEEVLSTCRWSPCTSYSGSNNVRVSGDVPNPDSVGLALQLSELAVEPGAT